MTRVAIAYCADNAPVAQEIVEDLRLGNITTSQFSCKLSSAEEPLTTQLQEFRGTILLVISDNFLKSISCMNGALSLLQNRNQDILPVIINGYTLDENGQNTIVVETKFDRIGDIIPYINYWQNQYLDLRNEKRRLEVDMEAEKDMEALHEHVRTLRQVSAEASEFLRLLRQTSHVALDDLREKQYQPLFQFMEDSEAWELFKATIAQPSTKPIIDEPMTQDPIEPVLINPISIPEPPVEPIEPVLPEPPLIPAPIEAPTAPTTPVHPIDLLPPDLTSNGAKSHPLTDPIEDPQPTPSNPQPTTLEPELGSDDESIPEDDTIGDPTTAPQDALPEELLQKALELAEYGETEQSISAFESALQLYPQDSILRYNYALLLTKTNPDLAPAIHQLDLLVQISPRDEKAHYLLAELYELQNQFEQAHDHYLEVSKINQGYREIFYTLGLVTLKAHGDKHLAASYFKMAAQLDPAHIDAHYQYAMLTANFPGKTEKAIKYFKKTLDLDPNHPFANYDLALLHYKEHHLSKARKCYLAAVENNPEFKTPENDLVFGVVSEASSPVAPPSGNEQEMLDALKNTIEKLEKLISKKEAPSTWFTHKTVLITGATSGIGRATAIQFAKHGHRLILTGRRSDRLTSLCEELHGQYQVETCPLVFDIRDEEAVKAAVSSLPDNWTTIDVLINNAGKAKGLAPIHEGKMEHWEEMIDTNIKGLLYITRLIAPRMVERKSGHIINLASIAGKFIYPNGNVYCATKAAVDALTQGMRQDLYKYNIRVSQVAPGHVEETEFALVRFDGDADAARIYEDFQPLTSEDVADTIYYLASRPAHVNIQDVVLYGTQQASATLVNRSGREAFKIL